MGAAYPRDNIRSGLNYGFSTWPGDSLSYGPESGCLVDLCTQVRLSSRPDVGRTAKDTTGVRANCVYKEGLTGVQNIRCMLHMYQSLMAPACRCFSLNMTSGVQRCPALSH